MPEFVPVLSETAIQEKVSELAQRISEDYRDRQLVLIGVLKGAFVFLADLIRKLTVSVTIDFVRISSYGNGDSSSGEVKRSMEITSDITGKDVLLVEDILDTGLTLKELVSYIWSLKPRSVRICAFIDKSSRRLTDCRADYTGHSVAGGFLVGYGLDFAEQYRNLPAIYEMKNSSNGEVK